MVDSDRQRGLPERYVSARAEPGVAPDSREPVGTMFAALYGDFVPHPWQDPDSDRDVYRLFYDRSLALGWLDDLGGVVSRTADGFAERETGAAGLWGMNDAGREHPLGTPDVPLIAWFQVGAEPPVPGERPLPVQPFLRCVDDVMARLGTLTLRAVQILLPVQCLGKPPRPHPALQPSLPTAAWFADGNDQARTRIRVTLDSGQSASLPRAVPRIRHWLSRLDQDVFVCESQSLTEHDPLVETLPFGDHLWNGPPQHRATFHGTLTEWSLDALGWLGGFFADLSIRHDVTTPLVLTASRT
ncbi:hypothetical protein B0I33_101243 [Prauserella shujinwangii]|uniref:Uncharacterized protein n=1 Tax=Prauserella shujinwangii TaxID=1453103 RepID=A0A2T0M2Y9_9PSEU|nr:hypothetical protein [Prauserella shujinwangii]PRX51090.1 hypothetical protein B0I33_101243 [Prauserella shujinwangii]